MKRAKQHIIVLGGGSAGWMTANLLQLQLGPKGFCITVIESPTIGIIGVGEGSTPQLKMFFDLLEIKESTWMPACDATYKQGIAFHGWTDLVHPQYDHYFHPFPSNYDHVSAKPFLEQVHAMLLGQASMPHPNPYFLTSVLADTFKSPQHSHDNIHTSYGYHFDSVKLGQFLKTFGQSKGINVIETTVADVCHSQHTIEAVVDEHGTAHYADWFFDCSGFSSKLMRETLNVPFINFSDNLLNDSAVAIPTPRQKKESPQTQASALNCGWAWRIPLTTRVGNGYVYSQQFCTAQDAEAELREHLGIDSSLPARHLSMNVGRLEEHWVGNTVGVGLSQGFIEPLEATALHLVQETVTQFIGAFCAGDYTTKHQRQFNQVINARFEGIRDYIVAHYVCNQIKNDPTGYWQHCRENSNLSNNLASVLACWKSGGDLHELLSQRNMQQYYPTLSWYVLLAGYRQFPHQQYQVNEQTNAITQQLNELMHSFVAID